MKTVIEMAQEIAAQYSKAERFQTWTHDFMMQRLMDLVAASAADEREACAKLADEHMRESEGKSFGVGAAIRARSNT